MPNPVQIQNKTIRILFLTSVLTLMGSIILFCWYVVILQKKTTNLYEIDETGNPPVPTSVTEISYVDNIKPTLLVLSSCLVFVSMFCLVYILTKFVSVFSSASKPIVNYLFIVLILLTNIVVLSCNSWYIFINPPTPLPDNACKDPLQFKTSDGKCVCVGNLTLINGACGCPNNQHRDPNAPYFCTKKCRSDAECGDQLKCNFITGECCNVDQIPCGQSCCGINSYCIRNQDETKSICCATKPCLTKQLGTICCDNLNEQCVPDPDDPKYSICQAYCGQGKTLICKNGSTCVTMTGSKDSIEEFKDNILQNTEISESDIEILNNDAGDIQLSYCAPPQLCEFTSEPQYFPTVIKGRGPLLDYYPCLISEKLGPLSPPTDGKVYQTPYDLNVCVPTPPESPYDIKNTNPDYFECFQRIRPADGSPKEAGNCDTGDGKCILVNLLHEDYSNPSRQDIIYRTIATNTFNLTDPNDIDYRSYSGTFCGHPAYRIINNTVSNNCTPLEAATACAQMGAYSDSKYIAYGETTNLFNPEMKRRYCNTFFDCRDFSKENQNRFQNPRYREGGKYFKEFSIGDIKKTYDAFIEEVPKHELPDDNSKFSVKKPPYIPPNHPIDEHYIYETTCPPMEPIDPKFLPTGCTGPDDNCTYTNCPQDLILIQSVGTKVNSDEFYNTYACTKFGHVQKKSSETSGKYFSLTTPTDYPLNFKNIYLEPNNTCNIQFGAEQQTNCFTGVSWEQIVHDYGIIVPLPQNVKDFIINSGDGQVFNLYQPSFDIERGNCSSQNRGIISKKEVINVGGSRCKWSAHLGYDNNICQTLPNKFRIYRVAIKKDTSGKVISITPSTDGEYTIRDNDTVVILGDDGYGRNFTGLGTFCNQELCPCFRPENAYVPPKKDDNGKDIHDDDGNLIPDWDHPNAKIDFEHGIFVINIEDDPYIYEELLSPSGTLIKWLRKDRAFSLRKLSTAEFFPGQYLKIDGQRENCRDCSGSLIAMQMHEPNKDFDSTKFMSKCTFVFSNTIDVVRQPEMTLSKTIQACGKIDN